MSRTRAVFTASLVLSALAFAGCSDSDPEPKFAPPSSSAPASPSTSTSTSPASDVVAPTMPAAAKKRSDAGAEAFARYYIDVLNYAQQSGDIAQLKKLSSARCRGCDGYVAGIANTYGVGGHIEGGEIAVGALRKLPNDYGSDWGGFGRGTATAQVIVDGAGKKTEYKGGGFPLYVYTTWRGDQWTLQWIRTPA